MHHLEQFLIEQDLRDGHESHEIIVGYNIQIEEICLAEYHPGIVFCEWEAGCVELLLPGRDFRFIGRHCCWRLGATDGSELCYRIWSFIEEFWNGVPQKMVVESQQCFGDGEYFLVDESRGFWRGGTRLRIFYRGLNSHACITHSSRVNLFTTSFMSYSQTNFS
jgi:hypothetical protein